MNRETETAGTTLVRVNRCVSGLLWAFSTPRAQSRWVLPRTVCTEAHHFASQRLFYDLKPAGAAAE